MAPCCKSMVRKVAQSSWDTKRNSAIWISRAKVSFWRDATLRGGDGVSPHDAHSMVHGPCGGLHGFFNGFYEWTPIPDLLQSHWINASTRVWVEQVSKPNTFLLTTPSKFKFKFKFKLWHQSTMHGTNLWLPRCDANFSVTPMKNMLVSQNFTIDAYCAMCP